MHPETFREFVIWTMNRAGVLPEERQRWQYIIDILDEAASRAPHMVKDGAGHDHIEGAPI